MLAAKRCTRVLPIAVPALLVCTDEHNPTSHVSLNGRASAKSAAACGNLLQHQLHWPCCKPVHHDVQWQPGKQPAACGTVCALGADQSTLTGNTCQAVPRAHFSRLNTINSRGATEQSYQLLACTDCSPGSVQRDLAALGSACWVGLNDCAQGAHLGGLGNLVLKGRSRMFPGDVPIIGAIALL